ncbi:MAG: hypothetical protein JRN62_03005 [Nitrososphaerota archaeon]|jgi:hypothetical protein|nr:hypothetical protein [Nitrososphaerota archaeon]MDG6948963.1 hypothetical protein [Nitrososphaerota archaeon]
MPGNVIAPEVPQEAGSHGMSKYVCVMCGYVTTVTNVCRQCREMPLTEELTRPVFCYKHMKDDGDDPMLHFKEENGAKVFLTHTSIVMVCVASVDQRLAEETGRSLADLKLTPNRSPGRK